MVYDYLQLYNNSANSGNKLIKKKHNKYTGKTASESGLDGRRATAALRLASTLTFQPSRKSFL